MNSKRASFLLIVVCFWAAFILLHTINYNFFYNAPRPLERQYLFSHIIVRQLWWWGIWILLTFVVLFVCRRFPLTTALFRHALIHLAVFVCVAGTHIAFIEFVAIKNVLPPPEPVSSTDALRAMRIVRVMVPMNFLLYCLILVGWHAFNNYRLLRERELHAKGLETLSAQLEAELVQSQLQALRSQLQPHFLFNTLNSIVALVRTEQQQTAIRTIMQLAELLRYVLYEAQDEFVSVEREMEFIRRYLAIEQVRFKDNLRCEISVQPEARDARIPSLLLQPLVENALQHGIGGRVGQGQLRIAAYCDSSSKSNSSNNSDSYDSYDSSAPAPRLCIDIENSGSALPEGWAIEANAGIGLSNVQSRLKHIYEHDALLMVENSATGGVIARLRCPFVRVSPAAFKD
jgi:hypothetical protein